MASISMTSKAYASSSSPYFASAIADCFFFLWAAEETLLTSFLPPPFDSSAAYVLGLSPPWRQVAAKCPSRPQVEHFLSRCGQSRA